MAKRTFLKRDDAALLVTIRAVGIVTIVSALLAVTTAWDAYDLSARTIGASIDHALAQTESLLRTEPSPGTPRFAINRFD